MRTIFFSCLSLISFLQIFLGLQVFGQCLNDQRSILLQLKSNLIFDTSYSKKLVHWNPNIADCCQWDGVGCESSGYITSLELDDESISGGLQNSTSLFNLQYLEKLSLAYNSFGGIAIPKALNNLVNLEHLNLSNAGFSGRIPVELSEMRNLVTLDLSCQFEFNVPLKLENPNLKVFVQNLTQLEGLYLDGVKISGQGNEWWQDLSLALPNIRDLSLRNCDLSVPLKPSLSHFQSLSVLCLDYNDFTAIDLNLFAEFKNLTKLTLSFCSLEGHFPESIFQIPSLKYLDISNNILLNGTIPQFPPGGSLRAIMVSYTNFSGSLPYSINNLPELVHLDLSFNQFTSTVPVFRMSKKLTYINLSHNFLNGPLSSIHFEGLLNLSYLNMDSNSLTGSVIPSLFMIPSLQKLILSNNKFSGKLIEFSIKNSSHMSILDLSSNLLEGSIPECFFELKSLNHLSLSFNFFNGTIKLQKFQNLLNISVLELSFNNFSVDVSNDDSELSLFPQLHKLNLASCNLYKFPNLTNLVRLTSLDLSYNKITGDIPSSLWQIGNGSLTVLNLSYNSLEGLQKPYNIPNRLHVLDLHSNKLQGELPIPSASVMYIDLSGNEFQGSIPVDIGSFMSFTIFFSLSNNHLTGEIPTSLCNSPYLQVLDLSGNFLSGPIPHCLVANPNNLGVLNLGKNNIIGDIPDNFSANCGLQTLDLSRNNLQGKLPVSITNCESLEVMNVGYNNIEDKFPCKLRNLPSLHVLVLRSNQFFGDITCRADNLAWTNLQIIDIAINNFSGYVEENTILGWRGMKLNTSIMAQRNLHFTFLDLNNFYYQNTVTLTLKGLELEFQKILTIFTSIDFSCNKFEGEIPGTIEELSALYVLNLSHNSFMGTIPKSIGNLKQLGSLDLSLNQLTGEIPIELTDIIFLSVLNLSYNSLVGQIPTGSQFQTFSAASFEGNTGLCGFPLDRSCGKNVPRGSSPASLGRPPDNYWLCFPTILGYVIGAVVIIFTHLLSHQYNEKCDRFVKWVFSRPGKMGSTLSLRRLATRPTRQCRVLQARTFPIRSPSAQNWPKGRK